MNEAQLELSVIELFQNEGYEYVSGDSILREVTDVLLRDDLRAYLAAKYAKEGITSAEIESIILSLVRASHDPLYDANKEMLTKITEGFIFRREDKTKKDLFIRLDCLNHAVEFVQLSKEMEDRFMQLVKRLKDAYNLCSGGDELLDDERNKIHFYLAVRSVLYKLTKGEAPDTAQMNKRVSKLIEEAIQAEGVSEIFTVEKDTPRMTQDIFSDEYIERINRIPMVNTKIKLLQQLLKRAIDDYKKINRIKGIDFTERMNAVVDMYNARRKDKAFANEVLDDVAEQLTKLLEELGNDKYSFEALNISFEEKAFFDILEIIAKKYKFYDEYIEKYGNDSLLNLAKEIKTIVDDKARYAAWSARDDIKAELKVNIILKLAEYHYPPVTVDDVYKEVLAQAENFRKYNE